VAVTGTLDAAIRIQEQEWVRRRERGCREERMGGMVEGEGLQWSVRKEGSKQQQQNRETLWSGK